MINLPASTLAVSSTKSKNTQSGRTGDRKKKSMKEKSPTNKSEYYVILTILCYLPMIALAYRAPLMNTSSEDDESEDSDEGKSVFWSVRILSDLPPPWAAPPTKLKKLDFSSSSQRTRSSSRLPLSQPASKPAPPQTRQSDFDNEDLFNDDGEASKDEHEDTLDGLNSEDIEDNHDDGPAVADLHKEVRIPASRLFFDRLTLLFPGCSMDKQQYSISIYYI